MFKHPVTVYYQNHMTKEYYTFKKNGEWITYKGTNVALYLPKYLSDNVSHLLNRAYYEGKLDGKFEENRWQRTKAFLLSC